MNTFLKRNFTLLLLFFITSCITYSDSEIHISIENNIRSVGTYYIIDSIDIPNDVLSEIEEILDKNLSSYGFIKLKDKDSQQTANYLVTIDLQDKDSNLKHLKISILDNTSYNLKSVFLGSIIFKKSNQYDSRIILSCTISRFFVTSVISENDKTEKNNGFSDIRENNDNQDCKNFIQ